MGKSLKKTKFYAVRKGRKPGIYTSWSEAEKQVKSFSGAEYKSFEKIEDANAYMKGLKECECGDIEENTLLAYVDGSYNNEIYSSGVVICDKNGKQEFYFWGNNPEFKESNNIAGEVMAALFAMNNALDRGIKKLILRFDLEGLEKWASEEYKTKKFISKLYKFYYEYFIKEGLEIIFEKVKGHSGDFCNDEADKLAKKALEKQSNIDWKLPNFEENIKNLQGYFKNTNISVQISPERFEQLKLYLKNERYDLEEKIINNKIIELKIKSKYFKEYLTLTYYTNKETLQIQGKALDVFNKIQLFMTELENYQEFLQKIYGISDQNYDKIEEDLDQIVKGAYKSSPEDLRNIMLTAYFNFLEAPSMPYKDFSFYFIPAARVLEAFIRKALNSCCGISNRVLKKENLGIYFERKGNSYKLRQDYINNCNLQNNISVIEECYNFYHKHRHGVSHASPIPGYSDTIPEKYIVDELILSALEFVGKLFELINKNKKT